MIKPGAGHAVLVNLVFWKEIKMFGFETFYDTDNTTLNNIKFERVTANLM